MARGKPDTDTGALLSLPLGLLLGRTSAAFRTRLLARLDFCEGDVRLIGLALAIDSNPDASQASYARFLGIDLNTASRLVNHAEAIGLLSRVPSSADRRAFVLHLSEAGQTLAARGRQAVQEIEAAIEDAIGQKQYAEFRRTAEQMLVLLA